MVGLGVAVGVGVPVGVGGGVSVGVGVEPTGQMVWLKRIPKFSIGEVPTCPATSMVTLGLKFPTTTLNTSEAPFLKLLNLVWNWMLVPVQVTLYAPRLPVYTLPFVGEMFVKPFVPIAT